MQNKIKTIFFIFLLFSFTSLSYADNKQTSAEEKNITLVKQMFTEFAEALDINQLDIYYTKDFILESNGKNYDYQEYKNLEQKIFQTLKSLKVTHYDDIFAHVNKVVSRLSIKLINKNNKIHEFKVILIASIKNNKIDRIWELTYPSWSDKLSVEKKRK